MDDVSFDDIIKPETPVAVRQSKTIKSAERLAREAEDARVAAVDAELKEKAAKARTKRALNKAAKVSSLKDIGSLVTQG